MADKRKPHVVTINGIEHELLLEPEDAKSLYGDNAKECKLPANKAGQAPSNK